MTNINTKIIQTSDASTTHSSVHFQIYYQTHAGSYNAGLTFDTPEEAVAAFLRATPGFECGELRLWEHQSKRLVAAVKWSPSKTELGFRIHNRANIFFERHLASIARRIRKSESIHYWGNRSALAQRLSQSDMRIGENAKGV